MVILSIRTFRRSIMCSHSPLLILDMTEFPIGKDYLESLPSKLKPCTGYPEKIGVAKLHLVSNQSYSFSISKLIPETAKECGQELRVTFEIRYRGKEPATKTQLELTTYRIIQGAPPQTRLAHKDQSKGKKPIINRNLSEKVLK